MQGRPERQAGHLLDLDRGISQEVALAAKE
jgi:hypothetical protein